MTEEEKKRLSDLIVAVANGRSDALDGIYLRAASKMTAVAFALLKNRADADDAVSESFLKIAKFAKRYARAEEPMAWILRIVRNTALDMLRAKKRKATVDIDTQFSLADESVSDQKKIESVDLENALNRLESEERKIIILRYFYDMTVREISKQTGLTRSSAERLIQKAEKNLKTLLESEKNG